jgi:membrane protease YdiL (CAAX protease family)
MGTNKPAARKAAAQRIIFVVACVLVGEWAFPPMFGRQPWAFSALVVAILVFGFLTHRALKETPRDVGLRMDNFAYSMLLLVPPMLFFILVAAFLGHKLGSLGMPPSPGWHQIRNYLWLLWWGLLQQYALHAIINRQAQILWGKGFRSIIVVGFIFAGLHLPNTVLMLATLAGGLIWAYVYQRTPNLFALALSHSVMTVVLIWALPLSLLHGLRVGAGYH